MFNKIREFLSSGSSSIVLFKDKKCEISLNPLHVLQGAFVFSAVLFLAITASMLFFPPKKIQTARLINYNAITVKQLTAAVAVPAKAGFRYGGENPIQPVKWTVIIKRS